MKNIFLSMMLLVAAVSTASAQEYKPFKLGLGLGYTMPKGGGGILFDIEPAYRVNDQIAVGLRFESAAMAKEVESTEAKLSANTSYTLNGQYYLGSSNFRPYVGLGFGLFSLSSVGFDDTTFEVASESKFGFYPRIGFDVGHFNVNLDYNIIPATKFDIDTGAGIEEYEIKNSYLGIRVGAFIFGGKI